MMRGSCLCGGVVFEVDPPFREVIACHCTQCRKMTGHFMAATSVPDSRFRMIEDKGLRWFRASPFAQRGHCTGCGAPMFWRPDDEARVSICAGAFDAPLGLGITYHIFEEDAGDYYSPEGPPPAPGAQPERLHGSCQCGANRFHLPGPAGDIWACHCSQCRKTSGHFSASFDAEEARVIWDARQDEIHVTSGGSSRGFCPDCGSSLWFRGPDGAFSIEAGCIDGPTGGRLSVHIFVADKGDYYTLKDGLPAYPGAAPD